MGRMVSLACGYRSLQVKDADLRSGTMDPWLPRNSNTRTIDAAMEKRNAAVTARHFANSWKGAGFFCPAPSYIEPHWRNNPGATNYPDGSIWDPKFQAPYPVCKGAGSPMKPVEVGETSARVACLQHQASKLPAAGIGSCYKPMSTRYKVLKGNVWPSKAPPIIPGVGRSTGGLLDSPGSPRSPRMENPRSP